VILLLAVVGAFRRWPWFVRLLLHAGWVLAGVMMLVNKLGH
jgi:hypothetical protein